MARAEHGTQLAHWAGSSPGQQADPVAPPPTQAAPAPTAPQDVAGNLEKKAATKGPATVTVVTTPDMLVGLSGLSVNASLDHYLGAGTFINSNLYASFAGAIDLSGRYLFKLGRVKLGASARGYVSYEYTLPDASTGRRWSWRDLSFGLSAPAVYKDALTGISFTPSLSFTVPITPESWQATTITVLSAGFNFTRSLGRFNLALSVGGSRGFHVHPESAIRNPSSNTAVTNGASPSVDNFSDGYMRAACRGGESTCAIAGNNTAWGLSGAVSVDFRATDALSFSGSYALRTAWRYANAGNGPDQYTPQGTTSNGDSVATWGFMQAGDLVITSLSANYQITDHWGASLFVYTAMPPRNSQGTSFRFPFWAFDGAANNYSSLGLSLSASF
ncbi:MAG: hypothetical protein IPJ65_35270 [Archangiaceae bacterium]|nr:hypothetical protein [Archangiaceae bacterium]